MLLLCLLLPGCVMAEEGAAQVYIAVDSGTNRAMLPLAGVLAYQAEQNGAGVQVIDLFDPAAPALYTSGSGASLSDALSSYAGKKLNENQQKTHISTFCESFFGESFSASGPADVYVLSGYERELMTSGKWDESKSAFAQKALKNAYSAVSTAMEANPELNIHFFYCNVKENTQDKLDEKLKDFYGDRVNMTVLPENAAVPDSIDPSAIMSAVFDSVKHVAQSSCDVLPADGMAAYHSTGTRTWLRMEFNSSHAPSAAEFIPDGDASSPIPAFCDTMDRFWLLLPKGTPSGILSTMDEAGAASNAPYTLTVASELENGVLTLSGADGLAYTPGQALSLPNENIQLTLTIDHPGFETAALVPSLSYAFSITDENGNSTKHITPLSLTPDETLANTWHAELPALAIGSAGELCALYSVWNQPLPEQVYPFSVGNRAPTLHADIAQPLSLTAYYDLPGMASVPMTFDLAQYFTDSDVNDQLSAAAPETHESFYDYQTLGTSLVYTAKMPLSADTPVTEITVNMEDNHCAQTPCLIHVTHQSVMELVDALHMALPEALSMPVNESRQYDLTLSAQAISAVDEAFSALSLPALKDALRIYVNDELKELTLAEDGSIMLSIPVAAPSQVGEQAFTVRAELSFFPEAVPVSLQKFFAAPQFTIRFINNPPRLAENVSASRSADIDISGFPGSYKAVRLDEIFGTIIPVSLFANDENETLTYQLKAPKNLALVYGLSDVQDSGQTFLYSFTSNDAAAAQPLNIEFLAPGKATIELKVIDSGNNELTVYYFATHHSVFSRILLIIVIVVLLLAAAAAATLLILKRMRPSFEGACADISLLRAQSDDKWFNPQTYITLPLSGYEKNPVTLMTLLTAGGLLPPRDCEADVLTHIVFAPEKDGSFRVSCSGSAAKDAAALLINGRSLDETRVCFCGDQELTIRFTDSSTNEMLFIRMYRR